MCALCCERTVSYTCVLCTCKPLTIQSISWTSAPTVCCSSSLQADVRCCRIRTRADLKNPSTSRHAQGRDLFSHCGPDGRARSISMRAGCGPPKGGSARPVGPRNWDYNYGVGRYISMYIRSCLRARFFHFSETCRSPAKFAGLATYTRNGVTSMAQPRAMGMSWHQNIIERPCSRASRHRDRFSHFFTFLKNLRTETFWRDGAGANVCRVGAPARGAVHLWGGSC